MTFGIILFILFELAFGVLIILAGKDLIKITSAQQALKEYKAGKNQTIARKYFLLWDYKIGIWSTEIMIKQLGDKYATIFYKYSGYFFLICSPIFFLAPIAQLQLIITF